MYELSGRPATEAEQAFHDKFTKEVEQEAATLDPTNPNGFLLLLVKVEETVRRNGWASCGKDKKLIIDEQIVFENIQRCNPIVPDPLDTEDNQALAQSWKETKDLLMKLSVKG